jgi:acyl carrier protein
MPTMNDSEIRALAAEALGGIAPDADLAQVGDDEDLREALDLDSMDFLNFVVALSAASGIKIPEADTPKLYTLRGLVAYLSAVQR